MDPDKRSHFETVTPKPLDVARSQMNRFWKADIAQFCFPQLRRSESPGWPSCDSRKYPHETEKGGPKSGSNWPWIRPSDPKIMKNRLPEPQKPLKTHQI